MIEKERSSTDFQFSIDQWNAKDITTHIKHPNIIQNTSYIDATSPAVGQEFHKNT
jgi:hypothetical protein